MVVSPHTKLLNYRVLNSGNLARRALGGRFNNSQSTNKIRTRCQNFLVIVVVRLADGHRLAGPRENRCPLLHLVAANVLNQSGSSWEAIGVTTRVGGFAFWGVAVLGRLVVQWRPGDARIESLPMSGDPL